MAKPIAVLYLPRYDYYGPSADTTTLTRAFNGYDDHIKMPDSFSDYLWFVFENGELVAPELKVFHEKDFTEMQYEELKTMIETSINELKTK